LGSFILDGDGSTGLSKQLIVLVFQKNNLLINRFSLYLELVSHAGGSASALTIIYLAPIKP